MLQVKQLKKSYFLPGGKTLPILYVEDFRLSEAEQCVLIGRSGGGKTTFLHIMAGITRADSGSVLLNNIELTKLSEAGRDRVRAAKLGYVFQTFNLLPAFTALENVRLGMTFARGKHDIKRATELLDRVGLGSRMHHKPGALSVGEQQRVAVARALANRPKILLADEPTANIDPSNQQKILDLIREVCRDEKVSLLMVTHDMESANQFDRIERLEDLNQVLHQTAAS